MSFSSELTNKKFQLNIVLQIGSTYFSQFTPDSGLSVDADKVGLISSAKINPVNLDIRTVRTTIPTLGFDLLDKDQVITNLIMSDLTNWVNVDVTMWVGFITGGFAFGDYLKVSQGKITSVLKVTNGYRIGAKDSIAFMNEPTFQVQSQLDGAITAGATTLDLLDASSFPTSSSSGNNLTLLKINNEFIQWTGKTDNNLTGLSRGDLGSTADEHSDLDEVFLVTKVEENPITALLQILLSANGDGANDATYDVLEHGGLGLSPDLVDKAYIESIRSTYFASDTYRFYLYDIEDTLKFLETEILSATNTRFIIKDAKISLAVLDQVDLSLSVPEIDETSIIGNPSWKLGGDKIVNKIIVKWAYSEGERRYTRISEFSDSDSITNFGERKTLELKFKGIQADLSGTSIASDRANRLLTRLKSPRAEIDLKAHFDKMDLNIGDDALITHRFLPQQGGTLGISDQLEILSKAINFQTGEVRYKLQFTSYQGLRIGVIAPCESITGITSQSVFTLADASSYKAGYFIRLWNTLTQTFLPDAVGEIASVSGNIITMVNPWSTTLSTNYAVRFADYSDSSAEQRARYAYISKASDDFDDGTKAYQISF